MSVTADTGERSRIIEAAYRCLVDTNGGGLSVTGVLNAAGLSTRAFYRHFDSKDALLLAMFRRDSDRVHAELTAAADAAPTPPEALRAWIFGFLSLTADNHRRRRVLVMSCGELMSTAGYAMERARMTAAHHAAIAAILERGRADGTLPWADPDADARTITAALSAAFQERMAQRPADGADSAVRAAEQVADFAFRALGAATV
ncbi:TetR/AcrR family transcriptional regulator [Dactylosporangium sp. NBC_01737]|uniref:TetR/AcrR family transcriptional regulator n=1 Tax=Dactylosporangium sp. NBC_01737 TaxID=2975959 RepID=UPI002E0EF7E1|nr:TetR/AcrR family transcriptional regulator [Dactylosporangium sp. NBC_01737]